MDMVAFFEAEAQAGGGVECVVWKLRAAYVMALTLSRALLLRCRAVPALQMQTCISLFGDVAQKTQACVEVLKAGSNLEAAFGLAVKMAQVRTGGVCFSCFFRLLTGPRTGVSYRALGCRWGPYTSRSPTS